MLSSITYWSNASSEHHATRLAITEAGAAKLTVESNAGEPERPVVGVFAKQLAREQVESLERMMRSAEFKAIPDIPPLQPGDAYRELSLSDGSAVHLVRRASVLQAAPAAFESAEAQALEILKTCYQQPIHAFSVRLKDLPAQISSSDPDLSFSLVVTNVGSEGIQISSLATWQTAHVSLRLDALRNDLPLAELREHHHREIAVLPAGLAEAQPPLGWNEPIQIAGKQQRVLAFRVQHGLSPGSYDVHAALEVTLRTAQGTTVLPCEAVTVKQKLTVGSVP